MNCANHPDRERVAFCQSCGKPLCSECVRNVGTSVFCEPCLAARVAGPAPNAGYGYPGYPYPGGPQRPGNFPPSNFPPGPAGFPPPSAPGEPSPVLAGVLGLIPGVGAMYNGQYAKGIIHLIVFAVLVMLADEHDIFALFVAGWICYMAIEAYHTARARRDGTPLPNPFGLNEVGERLGFGRAWPGAAPGVISPDPVQAPPPAAAAPDPAAPYAAPGAYFHQGADGSQTYSAPGAYFHQAADGSQTYAAPGASPYGMPPVPPIPPVPPYPDPNLVHPQRFPSGAIWLIALGVFFMVGNVPFFHVLHGRLLMPLLMIGLAVWIFVSRMTSAGQGIENDGTPMYHWRLTRAIYSSVWIALFGFIWLLDALHILSWGHSWPIYMIAAGVLMVFRRSFYPGYGYVPPIATPPPAPTTSAPVTTTALVPSDPNRPAGSDQEGR